MNDSDDQVAGGTPKDGLAKADDATFDVVVIGAGPAGEVAAGRLAEGGLEVAIVESHLVGGECSFYGCMPSKALLRPAQALAEVARVPGAREAVARELDVRAVLARRDEVVGRLDDGYQLPWLEERGITLLRGHARLAGERRVVVDGLTLRARRAVIVATGSAAAIPDVPGLREARPWTNREVTTSDRVPERLIVLGGGAIGAEMAQAWSTLGTQVVLIEALERLLPNEEPFAGEQVADALSAQGVDVLLGRLAARVGRNGMLTVTLDDGETIEGDELLVAVGRMPLTMDIGLESVGLPAGDAIAVDDQLRTLGAEWLYAVGDVNGRSLQTHMGKYQARVAADHILGRQVEASEDGPGAPRVIFTEPQVAAVGHTFDSARRAGLGARAVDHATAATAGGSFYGRGAAGTARLVVDEQRGVLVGATFTGPNVCDLLQAATVAVVAEVPLARLWHAVPAFPTPSEIWLKLLEGYGL